MGRDKSNSGYVTNMTDDVFELFICYITTELKSTKNFHLDSYDIVPEKPSFRLIPRMNEVYLVYEDPHVLEVDVIGSIRSKEFYKKVRDVPNFSYKQEQNLIRVLEMNKL